jgi:hypothetical protein
MDEFPDGPWSVTQGSYEGCRLIARINTGAKAIARDPTLAHRIRVAVPFREPNEEEFPGAAESTQLTAIEDAPCAAPGCGRRCIHLVTLTMAGFREFVFHTTAPVEVAPAIARVRSQHPGHEIQLIQEEDPDWDVYHQFM